MLLNSILYFQKAPISYVYCATNVWELPNKFHCVPGTMTKFVLSYLLLVTERIIHLNILSVTVICTVIYKIQF